MEGNKAPLTFGYDDKPPAANTHQFLLAAIILNTIFLLSFKRANSSSVNDLALFLRCWLPKPSCTL